MLNSFEEKYKRTKEDLCDLEGYLKELTNFLPLAVCTVNPLGIITDLNKATEEMTKYNSLEAVSEGLEMLFKEKERARKINQEIRKKNNFSLELTLLTKDKREIPVQVSVSKRKGKKQVYLGYFVAISDIAESKSSQERLEKEVEARTKELKERVEELEKFHDLTVGRELTMLELKKEIEKLKDVNQKRS